MNRPIPKKWLEPFRISAELGALEYEAAFTPRTALNRLNRLREVGWVDRHGETRATIYHLLRIQHVQGDRAVSRQPHLAIVNRG
ncbi:MAG: hypothetical protein WCK77_06550 [Verrucomicrobiota bacterium]